MSLPFTREQFLDVFRAYNEAVGLALFALLVVAVVAVAVAHSRQVSRNRVVPALLAALWLWSGAVYHWGFFTTINPAARLFGALFVAQAVVLFVFGVVRGELTFDPRRAPNAVVGWLMVVYALAIYPLLGWALGHGYPFGPAFGAPCPVTIFSLGATLWIVGRVPVTAIVIPVLWSIVGTSAAVVLGMYEDFALGASAIVVAAALVQRRLSGRRAHTVTERQAV